MGRPERIVNYTQEQLDLALELAVKGEPLKNIITGMITDESAFSIYCRRDPLFSASFERARMDGLEHIADGLLSAHDDYVDVQRARLKSDNAKWLLSKRKPSVYGDKVDIHVTQTIDISAALTEAKRRALPAAESDAASHAVDVTPRIIEHK